jgi:uncharacterized protein (DUF1697 family)
MPRANRYIAFLRAINVGGHTVKMDRLRALFEEFGTNVETFIASGNVIFDSTSRGGRALEKRIEAHLQAALGYPVATFLRTPAELRTIAERAPFEEADVKAGTVYVSFAAEPASDAAARAVLALNDDGNAFHVDGREVYWLRRRADSRFEALPLERLAGVPMTMRNLNTVRRLAEKYAP